ncbi:very short patch repair endonuclease [uncultured Pseudomonas sp.]|uniref:very short patch repair endonuclease n=1 Tax=uncultured Pseudomonas sp. TaxID=114707 RepID=UPI00242B797E|nr:very short patch repair endonuclease [Pseudomonas mosselii]
MCADIISSQHRSLIMRNIKGRNTKPELTVRSLCHSMGLRFRLHQKYLPGCPDLVFPKYHLCIFVNGCFWHQHPGCRYAYRPKSRVEFWLPKLARNTERDKENEHALKALGWQVEIVWECETKNLEQLRARIQGMLPQSLTKAIE